MKLSLATLLSGILKHKLSTNCTFMYQYQSVLPIAVTYD